MQEIADRLKRVEDNIASACDRASRPVEDVTMIVVTKTAQIESIKEVIRLGHTNLGENRLQHLKQVAKEVADFLEAGKDDPALAGDVNWHMIGHLQRNKVKKAVSLFDMIQSVDSYELAVEIDRRSGETGKIMDVLVEVNTSAEGTKFGCRPEDSVDLIERMSHLRSITVAGLMTIGAFTGDEAVVRGCFVTLRELARKTQEAGISGVEMRYLSMGMTSDFEIAIEEGSNMLRIGTAIFGPRQAR